MDTANDSGILLQRGIGDDVVKRDGYGVYAVEILEGPTDNPIRLVGPGDVDPAYQEFYTFGIEGTGWRLMLDILQQPEYFIEAYLDRFYFLVRRFPDNFDLLERGRKQP